MADRLVVKTKSIRAAKGEGNFEDCFGRTSNHRVTRVFGYHIVTLEHVGMFLNMFELNVWNWHNAVLMSSWNYIKRIYNKESASALYKRLHSGAFNKILNVLRLFTLQKALSILRFWYLIWHLLPFRGIQRNCLICKCNPFTPTCAITLC